MKKYISLKIDRKDGFSMIELLLVLVIIGILAAIAVPNLLKARRAANEASALASVRLIVRSEAVYKTANLDSDYATLDQLFAQRHIDETLGTSPYFKQGYYFSITIIPASGSLLARYDVQANPGVHSLTNPVTGTGGQNFGSNEAGAIYKTVDNTAVTFDAVSRVVQGTATPAPE